MCGPLVTTYMLICFVSLLSLDLSVLQDFMGSLATRALLRFPSKYPEREAFQDHGAFKDRMGLEGKQGHKASLVMQVSYLNHKLVVRHL